MIYLRPVEIFGFWTKMSQAESFIYETFGLMKGLNESEGWNHFLLFAISMLRNLQNNIKVVFTLDILAKETLLVIRRLVSESQRQENFEEEDTANSENNSLLADELSWDERDIAEEEDVNYDSVFDEIEYPGLFMQFL